ncbi:uncharacterized protein B0I36DRAFT_365164 [Microdochium trichocladiopsis]|uniref:Zn(2)-C6 fungal-type domain-containing protein n=1 Tax=Microdochium trichocladiopsis TaxID=1682393 RepID=A0A9P9BNS6_9PEZI|nr:uncharacterized protein B0I36DRAFT_365164 [Microdochium trichocladiopsis]KAH7028043.1 hypothetical protein B0I36DRAFT_365164 [Microdochium trichocladiopsis]
MFSTLRQTFGDGDRLLNVEIVPPFDKDRTSMRTACERCRTQKSKCVSGKNGCMLCVAKNRKCEYSVVSRPRRHASSVASGDSKSRSDDNTVANQHKQSNQAGTLKRRSRVQATRQSSPLSTSSSSSEDQVRGSPVSQSSLRDKSVATPAPDTGVEDAQQLYFMGILFPDSPGQVPAVFPDLDPAAWDFYGSVTDPTPTAAAKLEAGLGGGAAGETSTSQGDRGEHDVNKSSQTSPSANSLSEFSVDQMEFLMEDSRIMTTMIPNAHDNKVTSEAQPGTHFSPLPDLDATSTSTSTYSSCSCMMTAVRIYEALQVQLVWGDPVAGMSPAPSPNSASADSPCSSLSSSSGSGSGSRPGTLSGSATCNTTPLMTQQTILQRQKTMLARFESLLGCGTCWSRPDFVMLMITMCDRILTSLEAVERFVCSRTDDANRVSSNTTAAAAAAVAADVNATAASRAELGLPPLSRSPQVQQPRVGAWQIDDDDELELVISLIKSRVTRLGNLIAMAEGTVSANAWLSHERLAQALRRRSNKLLLSLSFRGFP